MNRSMQKSVLLAFAIALASIPVAAQHYQGNMPHSWDAQRTGRVSSCVSSYSGVWCDRAGHTCDHATCSSCTAPRSACAKTAVARPVTAAAFCAPKPAVHFVSRASTCEPPRASACEPPRAACADAPGFSYTSTKRSGTIAASWCNDCGHEHCQPGHLYTKNCAMLDQLQSGYCLSPNYVASLRMKNDANYGSCRTHGSGSCFLCGSSVGNGSHNALASLNTELQGLAHKCHPVD